MSEATAAHTVDPAAFGDAWAAAQTGVTFVSWLARDFVHSGVPREDLEAEGRLGLFDAALRFDAAHGVQFLTYASWWARRRMQTFVARQARVVRRPESRRSPLRFRDDVSLEDAVGPGAEQRWRDVLADLSATPPLATLLASEDAALVASRVHTLPPLWRAVLVRRFGLDGEPAMTLAAVGAILGLSRERVRQLEAKAMRRLREELELAWGWV